IETIAREGRKFFAMLCLISQRPVKLSTTVLSQCTNQAILRCTNPYDLEHIGRSSEGIDRQSLETITTLEVGEALFVGETVSVPTFVKVRKRHFEPRESTHDLLRAIKKADR
ncbi:MAG: ATP-binding protein, partial [Candidatus Thorarchaeota archaeon]|nr:ATP-binding protein [Candidatus Thorarchaeota archaeon]